MIIYHYVFNKDLAKTILRTGKIIPIDKVLDIRRLKDYGDRCINRKYEGCSKENSDLRNAQTYWRTVYDKAFEPVLHKPYKHYGIYLTPLDLFQFNSGARVRFNVDIKKVLDGNSVIQLGASKTKLHDVDQVEELMFHYSNISEVERIWKSSSLKFRRLPQIVYFGEFIKISHNDLEIKK